MNIQRKMKAMISVLNLKEIGYDQFAKEEFKRSGLAAMRALAKELPFKEVEVRFNPGGIAVSGDLVLHGMFEEGHGIYVHVNQHSWNGRKVACYCRAVTSMKDYTGKRNNWLNDTDLLDIEGLKETLVNISKEALHR